MCVRLLTLILLPLEPLPLVNLSSIRSKRASMSGLGGDFAVNFARETWALYAVGILGAVLRL